MCLSVPAKIESVDGTKAVVSFGGNKYRADISVVNKPEPGDYILLHAGIGIQKISEQHAKETLQLIDEINRKT